jgi:hypothetical protein
MMRARAAKRPNAMFFKSVVVRSNLSFVVLIVSGTAATMLVPTSFLHLEGIGIHPIGCSLHSMADKRIDKLTESLKNSKNTKKLGHEAVVIESRGTRSLRGCSYPLMRLL